MNFIIWSLQIIEFNSFEIGGYRLLFPPEKLNTKIHAQTSVDILRTVTVSVHVITCDLLLNKEGLYEYTILVYSACHGGHTKNVHRKFPASIMLFKATLYRNW
jgi:hypothetical protein